MCPLEQFSDLLQDQILPSKDRAVACAESKSVSDILKQSEWNTEFVRHLKPE